MRGVVLVVAMSVLLSACIREAVAPEPTWNRSAGNADLPLDLYICERWSRGGESPNQVHLPYLRSCMAARGWQETARAAAR